MKKALCLLLVIFCAFELFSCSEERSAEELLCEFLDIYGAEGVIYSPTRAEGEVGCIDNELFCRIYVTDGDIPKDYAIFLNSHTNSSSECGVFICEDAAERIEIEKMCLERMKLLSSSDSFISRSGNIIFYSTMSDRTLSEKIWQKVIG